MMAIALIAKKRLSCCCQLAYMWKRGNLALNGSLSPCLSLPLRSSAVSVGKHGVIVQNSRSGENLGKGRIASPLNDGIDQPARKRAQGRLGSRCGEDFLLPYLAMYLHI
jgi:hypothetical protein